MSQELLLKLLSFADTLTDPTPEVEVKTGDCLPNLSDNTTPIS